MWEWLSGVKLIEKVWDRLRSAALLGEIWDRFRSAALLGEIWEGLRSAALLEKCRGRKNANDQAPLPVHPPGSEGLAP